MWQQPGTAAHHHPYTNSECRSHLRPPPVAIAPRASHPGICKRCCLIGLPLRPLCCQTVTALAQQALHTILCKQAEPETCKMTLGEHNYVYYGRIQQGPCAVCNTQPCGPVSMRCQPPAPLSLPATPIWRQTKASILECCHVWSCVSCGAQQVFCAVLQRHAMSQHFSAIAPVTGGLWDMIKTSMAYKR